MALELGAAQVTRGPATAIGEIGGESVEVLRDAPAPTSSSRPISSTARALDVSMAEA
jgi:hypothetical protein